MSKHTDLSVAWILCYQERPFLANTTPQSSAKQRLSSSPLNHPNQQVGVPHPLLCAHHSQALLGEVVVDVGGLHGQVAG